MGTTKYILFGAGGHARVISSILEAQKMPMDGIFDSDISKKNLNKKLPILGDYDSSKFPNHKLIITIGDNKIRENLEKSVTHDFGLAIHPSSQVDSLTNIGKGTVIMHLAVIMRGTSIGRHCIINTSSSIDHDCFIDNFVHVAPGVTLCGGVEVGKGTFIGAGTTIIPKIKIGSNVIIGAGSVILSNIPDNTTVVGNPGRIIKRQ